MALKKKIERWLSGPIGWGRIVLLLIAAGGLALLAIAAIDYRIVSYQQSEYRKVPCYIESSNMSKETGRDDRNLPGWNYVPVVSYRYEYDGREYTGNTVCSRVTPITSSHDADLFRQRFGPGASAECYIDPDDPGESMLILPMNTQSRRFAGFGGLALALALVALGMIQIMMSFDTMPKQPLPRAPGWGEIDSGPKDPLNRTRQILRERLES